jgi:hypothetical protein
MPDLFAADVGDDSSDDETYNDEGVDEEDIVADEGIDEAEKQGLQQDLRTPVASNFAAVDVGLDQSFASMSLGGSGGQPKMVAVVQGDTMPYATIHSEWKADRQQRCSMVTILPSGTRHDDLVPGLLPNGRQMVVNKKWNRDMLKVPTVMTRSLLRHLFAFGIAPNPDAMNDGDYNYANNPIASGLMVCLEKLKVDPDENGDTRPTISHNISLPFATDRLFCDVNGHLTNVYDLHGLESDRMTNKGRGLWLQALITEMVSRPNTFQVPVGPPGFEPIKRKTGGWATSSNLVVPQAFENAANDESQQQSTQKRTRVAGPTEVEQLKKDLHEAGMELVNYGASLDDLKQQLQDAMEKNKEIFEEGASKLDYERRRVVELSKEISHLKYQMNSDSSTWSASTKKMEELVTSTNQRFAEMEHCANVAVANARMSAESVNECVVSCSLCLDACHEQKPVEAESAASRAQLTGQRAYELATKASHVDPPSDKFQQIYEACVLEAQNEDLMLSYSEEGDDNE